MSLKRCDNRWGAENNVRGNLAVLRGQRAVNLNINLHWRAWRHVSSLDVGEHHHVVKPRENSDAHQINILAALSYKATIYRGNGAITVSLATASRRICVAMVAGHLSNLAACLCWLSISSAHTNVKLILRFAHRSRHRAPRVTSRSS